MLREITLGQYYPVDSAVHRLDPRTKLFGTMVFIISLFMADSLWAYLLATVDFRPGDPGDQGAV